MSDGLYTPKDASSLTGASKQVIRVYTERYARYLSTEATPGPGMARRFTAADLRLIRFVYEQTVKSNLTHEQVEAQLAAGALDSYIWSPPEAAASAQDAPEASNSVLVPAERLQAALALLNEAQRRESEQAGAIQQMQAEIARLQNELGRAQGALEVYKRRRPKWFTFLFGE